MKLLTRQGMALICGVLLTLAVRVTHCAPPASDPTKKESDIQRAQTKIGSTDGPALKQPFETRTFATDSADANKKLGICYGPYREGQQPPDILPSDEELKQDIHLLSRHWTVVRLYSAHEFTERFLKQIRDEEVPLRIVVGAWLGRETTTAGTDGRPSEPDQRAIAANRLEVDTAVRLANAYPEIVVALCVGNETQADWSDHRLEPEHLRKYLREVREKTQVPVTTADDFTYWLSPASREIAAEIDFITCHIHPLWHGQQLDGALKFLADQYEQVKKLHPDRDIIVGETGWATKMHPSGLQGKLIKGKTGEAEQKQFYDEIRDWVKAKGVSTWCFEAFDEPWKGGPHPDEVEKHWGLYNVDRTPKLALSAEAER